jgi:hypothetical protein
MPFDTGSEQFAQSKDVLGAFAYFFDFFAAKSKPRVQRVVCTSPKKAYYRLASQEAPNIHQKVL